MVEFDRMNNDLMHSTDPKVCYVCLGSGRNVFEHKEGKINENVFAMEELVNELPDLQKAKPEILRVKPMFICKEHFIEMVLGIFDRKQIFPTDNDFVIVANIQDDPRFKVVRKYTPIKRDD